MILDVKDTHRAIEDAFARSGVTMTLGADAELQFPLKEWHEQIEARLDRLEQLQTENRGLRANAEADAEELQQLRAELQQVRAKLAAARKAAAFRKRKPTRTVELERDGAGAVLRAHVFEG
jgi:predicted nuclease with TOPRIM domain